MLKMQATDAPVCRVRHPAPQFEAEVYYPVQNAFKRVKLSDFQGKYVVLMWYPLDFTFVCPTEIIKFSDSIEEFEALNCIVLACSVSSVHSHKEWSQKDKRKGGLKPMAMPLLADMTKKISRAYGCLTDGGCSLRSTYIIDGKGILRHISQNDLQVGREVSEYIRLVQAFQYSDKYGEVCPASWKPGKMAMKTDHENDLTKTFFESDQSPNKEQIITSDNKMEFFYFPVHARGLFPRMIIAHLDIGDDEIKHTTVQFPTFLENKKKFGGPFGQLPSLKLPNGEIRNQTGPMIRYLAKLFKAKDGSSLYPGPADPFKSYQIDTFIDSQDDWFKETAKFQIPLNDTYKEKDKHFITYITKLLPARLQKIEDHLDKNKTKFLCADHITLADFAYGVHILKHAYNHKFEHEYIVRAQLQKYPRTKAWAERFKDYVWEYWTKEGNNNNASF